MSATAALSIVSI